MNTILLLLILVPVIEIYLLIKIGSQIGAITTIILIFTTAIVGIYYAKSVSYTHLTLPTTPYV